jgi:hypothetical protein
MLPVFLLAVDIYDIRIAEEDGSESFIALMCPLEDIQVLNRKVYE